MRLTRRDFIQASAATTAIVLGGCAHTRPGGGAHRSPRPWPRAGRGRPVPPRASGSARPAKAARSGARSSSSCRTGVRCAYAATRSPDQPRLRLPSRAPDPAAGVRPRPRQGADQAHQSGQGPRRRPEVGADHLGRSARHRRREDDGATPQQRSAQVRLHPRALFGDFRPNCSTARCRRSTARRKSLRTARSAPRRRRWGQG